MSTPLSQTLRALADSAERAARNPDLETSVALAFFAEPDATMAVVEKAIAAVSSNPALATQITDMAFISTLAVLSEDDRERQEARIEGLVRSNPTLRQQVGLPAWRKRLKKAVTLANQVRQAQRLANAGRKQVVNRSDLMEQLELFLSPRTHDGMPTIRRHAGQWYHWVGRAWEPISDDAMIVMVYEFLSPLLYRDMMGNLMDYCPKKKDVENFVHALISKVALPAELEPPFWIDAHELERPDPRRCIYFSDATLDVNRWLAGTGQAVIDPTARLFNISTLAVPYRPNDACPGFLARLSEIFQGDEQSIRAFRMMCGYLLTPDTKLQVIFVFVGLPGTGKGTLMSLLFGLLGPQSASTTLAELGKLFGLMGMVGKTLAVCSDVHSTGSDSSQALETILRVSGQDPVDVQRKFLPPLLAQHLPLRFAIVMNEPVPMPDPQGALDRRLVVFHTTTSFVGREVLNLGKQLLEDEGAGIATWMLGGLREMADIAAAAESKGLGGGAAIKAALQPDSGRQMRERLRELANPTILFVREVCEVTPSGTVAVDDLFSLYQQWCDRNHVSLRSTQAFITEVTGAFPVVRVSHPTTGRHRLPRTFTGITISAEACYNLGLVIHAVTTTPLRRCDPPEQPGPVAATPEGT